MALPRTPSPVVLAMAIVVAAAGIGGRGAGAVKIYVDGQDDVIDGAVGPEDKEFCSRLVEVPSSLSIRKIIHNEDFEVPPGMFISMICVRQQAKDGTGGSVTVHRGGLGFGFMRLRFKSKRLHGIKFTVLCYARKYEDAFFG